MLDRQSNLVETKTNQFLNSVSLPALRGPLLWGSSERRMWTTGRTGPCPEMDAAWRQVAVQTWLAGNTWLNRNIRYLMNTTGFTKCDSWLSRGWSPTKGWRRDSSWLITFWSASWTLSCSSQRRMCPFAQGNATREAFSASLSPVILSLRGQRGSDLELLTLSAPGQNLWGSARSIYAKFDNVIGLFSLGTADGLL